MEPHPNSQRKLREKLREKLNHWMLWRSAEEVILGGAGCSKAGA